MIVYADFCPTNQILLPTPLIYIHTYTVNNLYSSVSELATLYIAIANTFTFVCIKINQEIRIIIRNLPNFMYILFICQLIL